NSYANQRFFLPKCLSHSSSSEGVRHVGFSSDRRKTDSTNKRSFEFMNSSTDTNFEPNTAPAGAATKRVVLSMGGKGGVGKTSVIAALAEWFQTNRISVKLLDLDTENKAR